MNLPKDGVVRCGADIWTCSSSGSRPERTEESRLGAGADPLPTNYSETWRRRETAARTSILPSRAAAGWRRRRFSFRSRSWRCARMSDQPRRHCVIPEEEV